MAVITSRIPVFYRRFLYTITAASWLTGLMFFVLSRWFMVEGEFGPEKHPWQFPTLMIHGASAFLMMISYGALLISHVPAGWRLNRLRYLGIALISLVALQIITAWLLYYLGNETVREIVVWCHLAAGFALPFVLGAHILTGIRQRARRKKAVTVRDPSPV